MFKSLIIIIMIQYFQNDGFFFNHFKNISFKFNKSFLFENQC
jgi:hypothetical protein